MASHTRPKAQNPYINRHGGRTRYLPNRKKDPAGKSHYKRPGVPVPLTGEQLRIRAAKRRALVAQRRHARNIGRA